VATGKEGRMSWSPRLTPREQAGGFSGEAEAILEKFDKTTYSCSS